MIGNAGRRLGSLALRKHTIEVESKFIPTDSSLKRLSGNLGLPPFSSLQPCGFSSFHDEYYDHQGVLEQQSIWVRKRDGAWEAKCRRAGDFVHSTFEEVEGEASVARVVSDACRTADTGIALTLGQLRRTAAFTTSRREWLANARFRIAVDVTDFGHRVGEVELTEDVTAQEGRLEGHETLALALQSELREFMSDYPWAFPDTGKKPLGKLSAYFALPHTPK